MPFQTSCVRATAIAAAVVLTCTSAGAQNWPSRHVTIVVSFPAGGPTDVLARAVANELTEKLGQQFVVENRSGAAGNVGAASVAKSAPDGTTLLFATPSVINNRFMYKNLTFDTDRDLTPMAFVGSTPVVFVASKKTGLKRLDQLVAFAKANPSKLNYGSPGLGTTAQICMELLQTMAGIKLTHVPYRGSTPMVADLLGDQIDVVTDLLPTQIAQIRANSYAGIALTSSARSTALPDLPTVAESGFPGFEAISWNALLAPTGTPQEAIDKVNGVVNAFLKSDKGRQELAKYDMQAGGGTPEELKTFLANEVAKWGPIIKAAKIEME